MDDVHAAGPAGILEELVAHLRAEGLKIKTWAVHSAGGDDTYTHLRRVRRLTAEGRYIMPNPDNIAKAAWLCGFDQSTKGASAPLAAQDRGEEDEDAEALDPQAAALYKRLVGVLLHVALDRPDVAYAVRLCCRRLRSPTLTSMTRVRRVIKYLHGTRDMELFFPFRGAVRELSLYADSDWAGNKETRKSSSCGIIRAGACTLASVVRGQGLVAQSSAEAEFYAAVMVTTEGLHLQQLLGWCGVPLRLRLYTDSAAGRSALLRRGVGRMRHMQVKLLWVQDLTSSGRLLVDKIRGTLNPADIGTKPLAGPALRNVRGLLGLVGGGTSEKDPDDDDHSKTTQHDV